MPAVNASAIPAIAKFLLREAGWAERWWLVPADEPLRQQWRKLWCKVDVLGHVGQRSYTLEEAWQEYLREGATGR